MSKNIIICCDGTGNEYEKINTNVVKLFEVAERIPGKQIKYYDPGVGTISALAAFTKTQKFISKLLGLAFGYGITQNIEDAYEYLMDNYEDGDYVYLFGFSRGAFTVRALAGMIHRCGLLVKVSKNLIPYATKTYRYGDDALAEGFKKNFSKACIPHFVGVWDTVKSVGLFSRRKFPNSILNPDVNIGIHAISIDEKRSKYRPYPWKVAKISEDVDQYIRQVWFAGVHCDIGGSYEEEGLSNVTLKWMIDEARLHGMLINNQEYDKIKPCYKDKLHNSLLPFWWILFWWSRKIEIGSLVHRSVFKKIESVKDYNPKNLPSKKDVVIED